MNDLKTCSIIYNPISTGFKPSHLSFIADRCLEKGLKPKLCQSERAGHVVSLVRDENVPSNLILTMGGDGTLGEALKGFDDEQLALYSHISTGTANDTKQNFGLDKTSITGSIDLILNGKVRNLDVVCVNDEVFGYVSCFGAFTHIPYNTPNKLKKMFGKAGYGMAAVPSIFDSFRNGIPSYQVTYESNGVKKTVPCLLGAISNSKGFGGVNVYKNAKLDDGKFEVLLVNSISSKLLFDVVNDFYHNNIDLDRYGDSLSVFQTDDLAIHFDEDIPSYKIDNDGDEASFSLNDNNRTLHYKTKGKVKMLLP